LRARTDLVVARVAMPLVAPPDDDAPGVVGSAALTSEGPADTGGGRPTGGAGGG
jgi:hypothetical protein